MRVGFTGPRFCKRGYFEDHPLSVAAKLWMRRQVLRIATGCAPEPIEEFVVGGALDWDTWAAELAYAQGIPYVLLIPFEGYDSRWKPEQRERGNVVRSRAAEVVIVSEKPGMAAYHARNRAILDRLRQRGILVGMHFGGEGGSASTIRQALALEPKLAGYIIATKARLEEEILCS